MVDQPPGISVEIESWVSERWVTDPVVDGFRQKLGVLVDIIGTDVKAQSGDV